MNAFTVALTSSGFADSGTAVAVTWSISERRCTLSLRSTLAQSSGSRRSTR